MQTPGQQGDPNLKFHVPSKRKTRKSQRKGGAQPAAEVTAFGSVGCMREVWGPRIPPGKRRNGYEDTVKTLVQPQEGPETQQF